MYEWTSEAVLEYEVRRIWWVFENYLEDWWWKQKDQVGSDGDVKRKGDWIE